MKRTQKRIVGFLGLVGVAAITTVAMMMPAPTTQAVSTMTDTINVRVVSDTTRVAITSPADGSEFVSPNQVIKYEYESANRITVTLEYTDVNNVKHEYVLEDFDAGHGAGDGSISLNLSDSAYGYGEYKIKIVGEGNGGLTYEDAKEFSYLPVTASTKTDDTTGDSTITVNYDPNNDDIDKIEINVYDKDGNPVDGLSPITITPPENEYNFNVDDYDLDGEYLVEVTAYNSDGDVLYKAYKVWTDYKSEEPTKVPNTGIFSGTNISQTDYLVTGLLIFGIVAIIGIGFAMRNGKKSYTGKTNRRR